MPDEQPARRITLGKIVAYPVGVFLILSGLAALEIGSILGWILLVVGGLIALPIVRAKLKETQGISLSRWATVAIVLVLMVAGGMAMSGSDTVMGPAGEQSPSDGGPLSEEDGASVTEPSISATPHAGNGGSPSKASDPNSEENLLEGPPEALFPTVDDFGAGWRRDDISQNLAENETRFYSGNSQSVGYQVKIHDSITGAKADYRSRVDEVEQRRIGKDPVDVGQEGIVYKSGDLVVIQFRERNVVARVEYLRDSASLSQAIEFGQILHDSMMKSEIGSTPEGSGHGDDLDTTEPDELITGPPETLLPTIDDFGAGWRGGRDGSNASYEGEDSWVWYRIVVHDSTADAKADYQSRVEDIESQGIGKESADIGDESMLYKPDPSTTIIEFRVVNVVAYSEVYGPNAGSYAERLHDSITA